MRSRQQTVEFRKRLAEGETLDDLLVEAFAVCREAGRRFLGMRHYDVQMIGGMVLHSGASPKWSRRRQDTGGHFARLSERARGKGVHVVTVNDYLARRDMEWMGPLYMGLGLTVGAFRNMDSPSGKRPTLAISRTARTTNSASITCATTCGPPPRRRTLSEDMQQRRGR